MTRKTGAAITTACVSMAVGTAAYLATNNKHSSSKVRKMKKSTGRALRQVGEFIDSVSYMIK